MDDLPPTTPRRPRRAATFRSSKPFQGSLSEGEDDASPLAIKPAKAKPGWSLEAGIENSASDAVRPTARKSHKTLEVTEGEATEAKFVGTNWRPSPRLSPQRQKPKPAEARPVIEEWWTRPLSPIKVSLWGFQSMSHVLTDFASLVENGDFSKVLP